ncbi:MAG: alpha/beta fold hydrolase [Sandaracinaceae bacterium]|nr:alpha/beta fold hydrolase [Sandaracinaceae bacterium]
MGRHRRRGRRRGAGVRYSRPGYGASDATSAPRDPARIVEDLRALLEARGYAPPYVLVGHSFGGTYMELFAKAHPDEVAALVLVDPRHRDFTAACAEAELSGCTIPESAVATLPAVQRAEFAGFALASDQIAAAGDFGAYPVRVLTGTSTASRGPSRTSGFPCSASSPTKRLTESRWCTKAPATIPS